MAKLKARAGEPQSGPGTYFLSLTVENVRCFGPAQTLDLSDGHGRHAPWTVILGENGLGKTTLLTCLTQITSFHHMMRRSVSEADHLGVGRASRFSGWPAATQEGRALVRNEREGRMAAELTSNMARVGKIELEVPRFRGKHEIKQGELLTFHYGASRRIPMSRGMFEHDDQGSIFLDDDVALRDPEDWLLKADYNAHLHGAAAERFKMFAERVRDALINILPEVEKIRIQPSHAPGGSPRVEARTPDGWIPLRRLGFGYQSQIAWLVDLASRMFERYPDSPDPLAESAVVLVDEIDLHMHPRWQRQLIGYLSERFPNTQFIVTAHSPLVVQAAAGANIVLLRREGDHVVIDNDPEVLENWRVDQILTSELFGLPSARPPQIEDQLKERRALLAKARLSSRERARIAELEAEIGDLPAGESAEDRRAMELIRRAAAKLQGGT